MCVCVTYTYGRSQPKPRGCARPKKKLQKGVYIFINFKKCPKKRSIFIKIGRARKKGCTSLVHAHAYTHNYKLLLQGGREDLLKTLSVNLISILNKYILT